MVVKFDKRRYICMARRYPTTRNIRVCPKVKVSLRKVVRDASIWLDVLI